MADADAGALTQPLVGTGIRLDDERVRAAGISVALFVLTFCLFWFLGPKETIYSYQVQQANNILHGHLDFVPEYSPTLGVLERVLYDGEGFCFPEGNPRGVDEVTNPRITADCKTYMQHALGPAFIVLPAVAIWGVDLNQTLISVIFGAMTAPLVYLISRKLTPNLSAQLAVTALMMFGTIFWWVAANGGVWFFAHTTATFFLFAAIYFTIVRPNPLAAGALLGAAFMCRPTVIMGGLFFVVMFANLWLRQPEEGKSFLKRIDFDPLVSFVAGLAPFVFATMTLNYLRFDNPLESGYNYGEQFHQDRFQSIFGHGTINPRYYLDRHPPVIFGQFFLLDKPNTSCGQFECAVIRPSWFGTAIWATTPAFFLSVFSGVTEKRVNWAVMGLLAVAVGVIVSRAVSDAYGTKWATEDIPFLAHLWPFYIAIGAAVFYAFRNADRMYLACWAAIIPIAIVIFSFAATGWAQYGYRYALDFTPFVWLLVARFVADRPKVAWYVWVLIALSIAINLGGVLWHYQFQPDRQWGLEWVTF